MAAFVPRSVCVGCIGVTDDGIAGTSRAAVDALPVGLVVVPGLVLFLVLLVVAMLPMASMFLGTGGLIIMNAALGIVATVTSTATTGGIDAIVVAWHTALHGLQHLASLLGQQSTQLVDTRCRTVECGDNSGGGWRGSYACIRPQHTANTVVTVATIVTVAGTSAFVVTHAGTGTEPFNTTVSRGVHGGTVV